MWAQEPPGQVPGTVSGDGYHLWVLARNMQGYKKLRRLTSAGFLDALLPPASDKELLTSTRGLIGMSACLRLGGLPSAEGERKGRRAGGNQYREIFVARRTFTWRSWERPPGAGKAKTG
jgi:DNA polymerase-3 subunit alpha